jgi:hypothetical protein
MKKQRWRVYYHRGGPTGDWPFVWSIDNGSIKSQVRVQNVLFKTPFTGASTLTEKGHRPSAPSEPHAWFEGSAVLKFENGTAVFT